VIASAPIILPVLPVVKKPRSGRPSTPTLRSVRLRHGVLSVSIGGYRRGMRAIYRVDRRRYVRRTGTLRIRTRSWNTVRIRLEDAGGIVSRSLVIRRGDEF
jgi:hypothetical protein